MHAQTISITSPNGGEVWEGCTSENITWTESGTSNFYSIDYSVDNGSSWTSIATFYSTASGSYSWTIPNIQSTQALIRVQDSNNALVEDISNVPFSMIAPLLLISPNGGETWEGGTNQTIQWIASNTSNEYALDYSIDGGNTWILIDNYYYSTSGTFNWQVPNNPSPSSLVRVRDYNSPCKTDQSNQLFEISPPTSIITVTAPNGGNTLYVGQSTNISWNSQFVSSNQVQLEYSVDNGNSWLIIAGITENDGSYAWTIPDNITSLGLVRVTDLTNPATFDDSNSTFTIAYPFLTITSPNGGEIETQCEALSVTWEYGGVNFNKRFSLCYSQDNGDTWVTIITNLSKTTSPATYNWVRPAPVGDVLIRVVDYYDTPLGDVTDGLITLTKNNRIIVTYPNGGETLEVGQTYDLTWADNNINYVAQYYSIDNGDTWVQIDNYDNSDGIRSWTVPNVPTNEALIRIVDYDYGCIDDVSDAVFTIVQPSPTVNTPSNENLTLYASTAYNITWTDEYYNDNFVLIEFSDDNGASWQPIQVATENDGSFSWLVPENFTSQGLIRVSSIGDPSLSDTSDFAFEIQPPLVVTSPNGDNGIQDWRVCTETTITWTSGGTSSYFRLCYSTNNGNSWTAINTNYYSAGNSHSYDWQTPNKPGPGALVRVEDRFDASLVDESDAAFAIAPAITITAPNGGETLGAGEQVNITWINDGATNFCDIDYSTDNGSTWSNIIFNQFIASQSYSWTIPAQLSSNYLIRVRDSVDNCKSDESDQVFEVSSEATSSIQITNPVGGESIDGCTTVMIQWNSLATSNSFNVEYSLDGGINWINIASAHFTISGTYNWTSSNEFSNNMVFRVSDANAPGITDVTDAPISIQGAVADAGDDLTICAGEKVLLQASGGSSYS